MIVRHITQPDQFHGRILADLLGGIPQPQKVVIVSAFAGLQTVMRFKHRLLGLAEGGALLWGWTCAARAEKYCRNSRRGLP
jgi:hypothetical protein